MSCCGIVILAAGGSTRMGSAKQSLVFQGISLLDRAVQTALNSQCRPVVVVLGAGAPLFQKSLSNQPVTVVINEHWLSGMGTSIRSGIAALQATTVDAAMIFLCDQPLISPIALNEMVVTHFKSTNLISAAFYSGTHGTPAIFNRSLFAELLALNDGQGGKAIIERHAKQVTSVDLPQAEVDVDTRNDFERLSGHGQ